MHPATPHVDPALTIALSLAVGMIAQTTARRMRLPGIVLLLAAGVVLGPDGVGWIRPEGLGETLHALVGFAVAVILFEGGLNLNVARLRREARSIRQLVTRGAVVTAIGGTLAARALLGWPWATAALFGTLVIVTGPTVVTPLLRRLKIKRKVSTVLEAEGVFGDAIGAVFAVVALEVALSPSSESFAAGASQLAQLFAFGIGAGLVAGYAIAALLRQDDWVPEGLENVFTLSFALLLFQATNAFMHESGIVSVTVAGLVVGNVRTRALEDLREFKEQLTVLLIGMLFVLLAADVRLQEVAELGLPGLAVVLALMFVVRPLNVLVGTSGTDLTVREKAFIAWLAPRGIVAAAVSSLFAEELAARGVAGGQELRALVFLVIASTVLLQGLSGGWVGDRLGVRRKSDSGWVIVGASPLGLALGEQLRQTGEEVVFIDSSPDATHAAEAAGFRVMFGSALTEAVLYRAGIDSASGCIAVTTNEEINFLFAKRAREEFHRSRVWVALRRDHPSVTPKLVADAGIRVLFGEPAHVDLWQVRLERGIATIEPWEPRDDASVRPPLDEATRPHVLPLFTRRGGQLAPVDETTDWAQCEQVDLAVLEERRDEAVTVLGEAGWELVPPEAESTGPTDEPTAD